MIEMKAIKIPKIWTKFKICPSRIHPKIAAKIPSKLIIKVAIIGSQYFCPNIEKVYATPTDKIPLYKTLVIACSISSRLNIFSLKINENIKHSIVMMANLKKENFNGSIFLIYLGT